MPIDNRLKLFKCHAQNRTVSKLFEQYTADLETIQADMHSIATANPTGYLEDCSIYDDIERAVDSRPIGLYRRDAIKKYRENSLKEELIENIKPIHRQIQTCPVDLEGYRQVQR